MQLDDLGWNSFHEINFEQYRVQGLSPMRIVRENRLIYTARDAAGEYTCEVSGKFRFEADAKSSFPAVGDWVAAAVDLNEMKAVIHSVLPRRSVFSRKAAGRTTDEQIIAANIDVIFIVTGLDLNYNLRRIERYLSLAVESDAEPVIVLNKSDICNESEIKKLEVESIANGVDVCTVSAFENSGLDFLKKYIGRGKTVAFLGSSGVGKSTIINSLLGEEHLKVNSVSETGSRGRHTTTFRELIILPDGGMVIDTPGMRELQVWGDDEGLKQVFDDIEELNSLCRFSDCSHETEPGCAVQEAISSGSLDPKRLESYLKLKKEFIYLEERQTMKAGAIEKAHWKKISKLQKNLKKDKSY